MRVLPYGQEAVLAEFDSLAEVLGLTADLELTPPVGVIDVVPAARSVMVWFDQKLTDSESMRRDLSARDASSVALPQGEEIEVPLVYDGEDLAFVADSTGLTEREVVARHLQPTYVVAFIGMAPGFYFLAGGDPSLRAPRRRSPRTVVPRGGIGLAGEFTGIYPRSGPGGWQLIGTTPADLWHSGHYPSARLAPGTRVRFVQVAPA